MDAGSFGRPVRSRAALPDLLSSSAPDCKTSRPRRDLYVEVRSVLYVLPAVRTVLLTVFGLERAAASD